MPNRRILSLWFPRLSAERVLRAERGLMAAPFAIAEDRRGAQVLASLSVEAEAAGLTRGQPLRDARAMCPELVTRLASPRRDAAFLAALRRWAGKFSPWVSEEAPDGLMIDLTGCAHLFGGEVEVMRVAFEDCADHRLSVTAGIADTVGAAWALARYGQGQGRETRSGDDIQMEARATRSRAARRRLVSASARREAGSRDPGVPGRIAPPGGTRAAIAPLPVAALRIDAETRTALARVGLRRIGDLAGQPRAALARRFGVPLINRLDQASGVAPEPVSPARPPYRFAVRMTFPEPIGLEADILAALDRLLPALQGKLDAAGRGARRIRLEVFRSDHTSDAFEIGLARPSSNPDRIRPLLAMKTPEIEAGFGIDVIRVTAPVTEPVHAAQHSGHVEAGAGGTTRRDGGSDTALADLIGRLGARVGLDTITRLHPVDTHIPEKTASVQAAAWSEPARDWPAPPVARPVELWSPELVDAPELPQIPATFRWRGRAFTTAAAQGPERLMPEWWLDMPDWRTGVRDYWRVTTTEGERLWLYYAHGGAKSGGWFCHGSFG
jgi:protein ImuB